MFHIPNNTCIEEVCSTFAQYAGDINQEEDPKVLMLEAQMVKIGNNDHVLMIYTGDLVDIYPDDILTHLDEEFLIYKEGEKNNETY